MTLRFWTSAEAVRRDAGWAIALDFKPMRLPAGAVLRLRNRALASAVAGEWRDAGGGIKGGAFTPHDVPLTGLAGAAQERVAPDPAATIRSLAGYAETDLLCYRLAVPADLAAAQAAQWQPWLDWAARVHRAPLAVTTGIVHVAQQAASLAALRQALAGSTIEELAALGVIVPGLGSCVLGLAMLAGELDTGQALALAELDSLHQQALWGEDPATLARRERLGRDIASAIRFVELSRAAD